MKLTIAEPVELIPGWWLRHASKDETGVIRNLIARHCPYPPSIALAHYETRKVKNRAQHGYREEYEKVPVTEWCYNVITLPANDFSRINQLEQVSNICVAQFELPLIILPDGGTGGHSWRAAHFLAERLGWPDDAAVLDMAAVKDFQDAYYEFMEVKDNFPEIARALELLDQLKSLPSRSEFEVLGLFAIIEMLITHNPQLEDAGDSITHQMKAKIPLLSKRFPRPLDYSGFEDLAEDKVWAKMYAYRSSIAHGGEPDFSRGELRSLKSRDDAVSFLRTAVRSLIRHSFKEPQLYRDLKEC